MTNQNPGPPPDGRRVRAALLQKVCGNEEMFALGSAIARVVQMATSDDQGTHDLAHYVLSDVALTQRILRLANTVRYRIRRIEKLLSTSLDDPEDRLVLALGLRATERG